mgnify:CR=1 FL=1
MASPSEPTSNSPINLDEFNVWEHKPWWCQPWSIVLTGVTIIGGSWWLFHRVWLTGAIALPISAWMGYFVLLYPRLVRSAIAAQSTPGDLP